MDFNELRPTQQPTADIERDPDFATALEGTNSDSDPLESWKQELNISWYRLCCRSAPAGLQELFRQARELTCKGSTIEALRLYGDYLLCHGNRLHMDREEKFGSRYALMKILRILRAQQSPSGGTVSGSYRDFLATEIFPNLETEEIDVALVLLPIYMAIVCFILLHIHDDKLPGQQMEVQLLEIVDKRAESQYDESRLLVEYLAEHYTGYRSSFGEVDLPSQAKPLIRRHLAYLKGHTNDPFDESSLAYLYKIGSSIMVNYGMVDEAVDLFLQAFNGRTICFGEVHKETDVFICELIRSLCKSGSDRQCFPVEADGSHPLIHDLIVHCLDHKRYSEVESLIWECLRTTKTVSTSENSYFPRGHWPEMCNAQSALASHKTPQIERGRTNCGFWEDSRMYLRRWANVTLAPLAGEPSINHQLLSEVFSTSNYPVWIYDYYTYKPMSAFPLLEDMRYTIEEINDRDIHMTVPFLPYENFQKTQAWRDGYTYTKYMRVLRKSFLEGCLYERVRPDTDRKERKSQWCLPTEIDVSLQNRTNKIFSRVSTESFYCEILSILSIRS
jgi:hypothetical protein